jgi:phosphinothricin acetyltransferase
MIRDCSLIDAEVLAKIYNYYIKNTVITFEEDEISVAEMAQRIESVQRSYPWIVYEEGGVILGYAYAGEFKGRCAYRFTLESSIYLDPTASGKGIGLALYQEIIHRLQQDGYHSLIGVVAAGNPASTVLHQKLGFKLCGTIADAGYKFARWIDVEYWQLKL